MKKEVLGFVWVSFEKGFSKEGFREHGIVGSEVVRYVISSIIKVCKRSFKHKTHINAVRDTKRREEIFTRKKFSLHVSGVVSH